MSVRLTDLLYITYKFSTACTSALLLASAPSPATATKPLGVGHHASGAAGGDRDALVANSDARFFTGQVIKSLVNIFVNIRRGLKKGFLYIESGLS